MDGNTPTCFRCNGPLDPNAYGRREECPNCMADVHVCKNCKHYDVSAYNECHEPQADRVVEKERSNFCDYFSFASPQSTANGEAQPISTKDAVLAELDKLFQK